MEIWRNKFTGENSELTEAQQVRQTVGRFGHPSCFGQKNIQNLGFLLFVSYDLMSCEVFTQLAVNNKLQFFLLFQHIIRNLSINLLFFSKPKIGTVCNCSTLLVAWQLHGKMVLRTTLWRTLQVPSRGFVVSCNSVSWRVSPN